MAAGFAGSTARAEVEPAGRELAQAVAARIGGARTIPVSATHQMDLALGVGSRLENGPIGITVKRPSQFQLIQRAGEETREIGFNEACRRLAKSPDAHEPPACPVIHPHNHSTRKAMTPRLFLALFLIAASVAAVAPDSHAGPRHPPANPRGAADPRGVLDPRGVADPRGVFDSRGPFDPSHPARCMHGLPAGYATRTLAGARSHSCSGIHYYPPMINGQTVYPKASVVNGVPAIPPRPY